MILTPVTINCQNPENQQYIRRKFTIIQCELRRNTPDYNSILERANQLASLVNTGAANNSEQVRNFERRLIDFFGGLCAESGWEMYINDKFGQIAQSTPFTSASVQIDIELAAGERIEVRSSFPYKGVKFALCNNAANFKNIGPYSNTIKPGEVQKNLYLAVLFDTPKSQLLTVDTIKFSLVGGSTWNMMVGQGQTVALAPRDDDSFAVQSAYKVIYLKNALDAAQIIESIGALGYSNVLL